jgi:hypothetical protein
MFLLSGLEIRTIDAIAAEVGHAGHARKLLRLAPVPPGKEPFRLPGLKRVHHSLFSFHVDRSLERPGVGDSIPCHQLFATRPHRFVIGC